MTDRHIRVPLGAGGFAKLVNVSRETLERLNLFVDLLTAWNRRINLVGRDTMGDVWRRHILDSAQLYALIPPSARILVDLGSGGGFPGLVLAILGAPQVHLVEADQRKAVFLREAIRITGATATVHAVRLDRVKPFIADVITARALAPLGDLLEISADFRGSHTVCLFPKGHSLGEELTLAAKAWKMRHQIWPSLSDPSGGILRLENIAREPSASSHRDDHH